MASFLPVTPDLLEVEDTVSFIEGGGLGGPLGSGEGTLGGGASASLGGLEPRSQVPCVFSEMVRGSLIPEGLPAKGLG